MIPYALAHVANVILAQATSSGEYRRWVWLAYGLVLVFLAGYSFFLVFRTRVAERRVDELRERLDHAKGGADHGGEGESS